MNNLSINNITFSYPQSDSEFKNIDINFNAGESVAIVGQNGAGKTTLSKLMIGLLKPSTGNIMIGDLDTRNNSTAKISSKVGYVFQNPDDQIFHNNVLEEIEFGPKSIGLSDSIIKKNVQYAVEITNLGEHLNKHPYDLPYSMRKFVTIASVLAMDPQIIILDEPTAGQDLYSLNILSSILDILKKENKLVITITHDMEFVTDNFERIIVMADRQVIADGNKQNIFGNDEILERAFLKKPYINRLATNLNLDEDIFEITDFINHINKEKIASKTTTETL